MRFPVYRNLDTPFRLFGFTVIELIFLCFAFVGGSELAQILSFPRIVSLLAVALLALTFFSVRRFLGEFFARRLVRFITLPSSLFPRLIRLRGPS